MGIWMIAAVSGCETIIKDYSNTPDNVAPGPVTNVSYTPFSGGVTFHYTLPDDEDIMGVKAVYTNEMGKEFLMLASGYIDTLTIIGLNTTEEREVNLYAIDNSGNVSTPVTVLITPGESELEVIAQTIVVAPSPGGIKISWDNPTRVYIAVETSYKDASGNFVPYDSYYSDAQEGRRSKLGSLEAVPVEFAVYVRNRWGNQSEVKYFTVTPDPYVSHPDMAGKVSFTVPYFHNNSAYTAMQSVSYEAWIKINNYSKVEPFMATIMGVEDGTDKTLMLRMVNDDVIQASAFGGGFMSNTHLELNKWYHLALTYDGSTVRLYINGQLDASRSRSGYHNMSVVNTNDGGFMIGQSLGARFFDGEIRDVRVWRVARTETEIRAGQCGVDPYSEGLIANWKFDEGHGTEIKDASPNHYDITSNGAFEWIVSPPCGYVEE
jgi:hypothetical protein